MTDTKEVVAKAEANAIKVSTVDVFTALGLAESHESKSAKIIKSVVLTYNVSEMHEGTAQMGAKSYDNMSVVVAGNVPFITEDGVVGANQSLNVGLGLKNVLRAMGVKSRKGMEVLHEDVVNAFATCERNGLEIFAKIKVDVLETFDGKTDINKKITFIGEDVNKFAAYIKGEADERINEMEKHPALFQQANQSAQVSSWGA